jgi:hypothetical protein
MSLSHALHPRRPLVTTLVAVASAALLVPLTAAPAAAAPLRPGSYFEEPAAYDDSGEFDPECPGLDLTIAFRARGVASLRNVVGSGRQAFLVKDRYRFREVWSDDATGRVLFTIRGRNLVREVDVRRVARSAVPDRLVPEDGIVGPVFEFTVDQIGGDIVRDADGQVLYWNAGRVVFKNLFDSMGDRKPGGESLRFRPIRVIGPHPLLETEPCEIAEQQLAAP